MKNKILKTVCTIFAAAAVCAGFSSCMSASEFTTRVSDIIASHVSDSLDSYKDNYDDDTVIVVLTQAKSLEFKSYSVEDFSSVELSAVENLMAYTAEQIEAAKEGVYKIAAENYRQILLLTLANPGKENVLAAVEELEKIEWVESASPNYVYSLTASESAE